MGFLCAALFCILFSSAVRAEVYSAVTELNELLKTETALIDSMRQYINLQDQKLDSLKRHLTRYESEHARATDDADNYLSNPMNAYLLVKRLHVDWYLTDHVIRQDMSYEMWNIRRKELKYPTVEDLFGMALAIIRLQETYKIDTHSLARGEQNKMQFNRMMSTSDCFELGKNAFNGGNYQYAESWLDEALTRDYTIFRWSILEHLALSALHNGNKRKALALSHELVSVHPDRERAMANLRLVHEQTTRDVPSIAAATTAADPEVKLLARYRHACRHGGRPAPAGVASRLRCRYTDNGGDAFLLVGPLREEEVYLDPRIVIYRDLVRDGEVDAIKRVARPRLLRTIVQNGNTGEARYDERRVSKSTWLEDDDDVVVARISKRIESMTGLTSSSAEQLEVINYGVGGQYEPHYDFFNSTYLSSMENGNRIATVLIYLSDVELGGVTAFLDLDVSVQPVKGSVVVWFNLLPDGNGDKRTLHAACPVLKGSKWSCNKWLHTVGQEFRRPCGLEQNVA